MSDFQNKLAQKILQRQQQGARPAAPSGGAPATTPTDTAPVGEGQGPSSAAAPTQASAIAERMREDQRDRQAVVLFCSQIEVREQARKTFKNLEQLAADIRDHGQLQPIIVVEIAPHRYLLKIGERRLRAIRDVLKQDTIFARIVKDDADATRWRLSQLAENIQREEYEPLELAAEFAALKAENGWTNKELGERVHASESWISKKLSLLEAPDAIRQMISSGQLSETEYFNNKAYYRENLDAVVAASESDTANADGGDAVQAIAEEGGATGKPAAEKKARVATLAIPMRAALDIAEVLRLLAERHKLNPIELGKKPSKKELIAILTTRSREIKRHL